MFIRPEKLEKYLIALPGKGKIFFRNSPLIMRGKSQRYLVKANINIRMVLAFLGFPGNPVNKSNAL